MDKVVWILVNCNSIKEAEFLGKKILKERLVSCFDIIPRHSAFYYWPPRSGKIEKSEGATLILETFIKKYKSVARKIKKHHSATNSLSWDLSKSKEWKKITENG